MEITEDDVIQSLDIFTAVPVFLLKRWAGRGTNLAAKFRSQIMSQYSDLSMMDRERVKRVLEMDVSEIQEILERAYIRTGKKQLKILADPSSRRFIEVNLREVRGILDGIL
ncbi:hypothetical protein [Methanothermobacter sp. DP]|uniref:hypothetical protein n=1 Tax=Methanothermobacter sp. DP TaxID=2998972 RepID=UPI002AA5735F|nr:hypothetical protein [Methanothermobacter sp. DP]